MRRQARTARIINQVVDTPWVDKATERGTIEVAAESQQDCAMARYQSFLGKHVHVLYRAGDVQLSASGALASDSGASVYVEDRFLDSGKEKIIRVEIPYGFLISLEEKPPHTSKA